MKSSRRSFLKSLATMGAATPLSMAGMSRLAFAADTPKLKVIFAVIPDGFAVDSYGGYDGGLWFPETNEKDTSNFALRPMSEAISKYRNQSVFLKGLIVGSGTGGHNGWTTILRDSNASQSSIDVILGDALPGANPTVKRIFAGPHAEVGAAWTVSYQGTNRISPEASPYVLFNDVFNGVSNSAQGNASAVQSKDHLFDPVLNQINEIKSALSGQERAKLTDHLDAVETLASDLRSTSEVDYSGCNPSSHEPMNGFNITSADYRDQITDAHSEVLAGALSCGISRVGTLQIGRSADQVVIKSVSSTRNPHDCAHRYGSVDEWKNSRIWYMDKVTELLDKLASLPDPDVPGDNLLEHTLVVLTSEMADGAPEHMQDVPVTLIGGASGLLKNNNGAGRFYDLYDQGERSHWKMGKAVDMQRVWATIAAAAGTSVPYSGNVTPIPNLFSNV
jgi:hypothetical protein